MSDLVLNVMAILFFCIGLYWLFAVVIVAVMFMLENTELVRKIEDAVIWLAGAGVLWSIYWLFIR